MQSPPTGMYSLTGHFGNSARRSASLACCFCARRSVILGCDVRSCRVRMKGSSFAWRSRAWAKGVDSDNGAAGRVCAAGFGLLAFLPHESGFCVWACKDEDTSNSTSASKDKMVSSSSYPESPKLAIATLSALLVSFYLKACRVQKGQKMSAYPHSSQCQSAV